MDGLPMLTDMDLKSTGIPEMLGSPGILKRIHRDYWREPRRPALLNLQFASGKKSEERKHTSGVTCVRQPSFRHPSHSHYFLVF